MMTFFQHILTETDNKTFDVAKVLAILVIISGLIFQGHSIFILKVAFDMQNFGIGIGALFAGLAVALGMKKETPVVPPVVTDGN